MGESEHYTTMKKLLIMLVFIVPTIASAAWVLQTRVWHNTGTGQNYYGSFPPGVATFTPTPTPTNTFTPTATNTPVNTPTPDILSGSVTWTNAKTPVAITNTNFSTSSKIVVMANQAVTAGSIIFSAYPISGAISIQGNSTSAVTAFWLAQP